MVLLLYSIKSQSPSKDGKEWVDRKEESIYVPLEGFKIPFSCAQQVNPSLCAGLMTAFTSATGALSILVNDTKSYWEANSSHILACVDVTRFELGSIEYTISMDDSNLKNAISYGVSGAVDFKEARPGNSLAYEAYVSSGFSFIQRSLDCSSSSVLLGSNSCNIINPMMAAFPTVRFQTYYSTDSSLVALVPFYMVIAFVNIVTFVSLNVVMEKQAHMVETLRIMGMHQFSYWASWQLTTSLIGALSCVLSTVAINFLNIFPNSNLFIIFLILFFYCLTLAPIGFVISTLISHQRVAAIVAAFGSIAISAPTFALSSLSNSTLKSILAIFSPLAMCEGLAVIMQFEVSNEGINWSNIRTMKDGFSVERSFWILALDLILYFLLAWYLYQIVPGNSGQLKHPFFCLKSASNNQYQTIASTSQQTELIEDIIVDDSFEICNDGKNVQVRGLSKTYKSQSGKLVKALDNLTCDMQFGQIFCLLGHNGAGKSTAISILTGLTAASSGDAQVLGHNLSSEVDSIRLQMGYCPQHDTLFQGLSVEENLELFAKLKGKTLHDANIQLESLGLIEKRSSITKDLSGGQKRALSVAIALVGKPNFIVLDEPTAGMDPGVCSLLQPIPFNFVFKFFLYAFFLSKVSRRRVWDALLKDKGERVTLLTTHFLDEADVLGDKIAILAHGRLECLGSPLFLKNRLGVGYHLTFVADPELKCECDKVMSFFQEHAPGVDCGKMPETALIEGKFYFFNFDRLR